MDITDAQINSDDGFFEGNINLRTLIRKWHWLVRDSMFVDLQWQQNERDFSIQPLLDFFMGQVFVDPTDEGRRLRTVINPDKSVNVQNLATIYILVINGLQHTMFSEDGWVTLKLVGSGSGLTGICCLDSASGTGWG